MKAISKLVLMIVISTLLISTSTSVSTPSGEYDPWMDLDDDGDIDLSDIVAMAGIYGSQGDPFAAKASLGYDSDWINCTDLRGEFFDVYHNFSIYNWNREDIMVEIIGKTSLETLTLHRQLGITWQSQWGRAYGGTSTEHARSVVQTEDGGYVIGGYTVSLGAGAGDFWLVKTDASGNLEWSKTYGGPNTDVGWSVVQTEDGGYAIAGFTWSFGVSGGSPDIWLVKTDASGNCQWNHTYGGIDGDVGYSVVQTEDGGYAIAGYRVYFGRPDMDVWLVKTDPLGNHEWNHTYGGPSSDGGHSVVQTEDGGYAIAGYTYAYMVETSDMWLLKTDAAGNHQWNQTYGGSESDLGYTVVQTEDTGYAIAGYTLSFGAGSSDVWLVKTDPLGNHEWNHTYGGHKGDYGWSVVQTEDGGYAIAGYTYTSTAGGSDVWLIKTDASGSPQWNQTYGGADKDAGYSVVQTEDGGYAIAGDTWSFDAGSGDIWLVRAFEPGYEPLIKVEWGLTWTASAQNTITLYRGEDDPYWNYARIRIWTIKDIP